MYLIQRFGFKDYHLLENWLGNLYSNKKNKFIFNKINKFGKKFNLTYAGMHALDILRLEKKFLHWGHDITSENNPFEVMV